jgi:hypothetical protein
MPASLATCVTSLTSTGTALIAQGDEPRRFSEEIGTAIQQSPVWRVHEDLLRTVPGIAPTVARTQREARPPVALAESDRLIKTVAGLL